MVNQKLLRVVVILFLGLIEVGCSFPSATTPTPSPNPELIYTLAAETVQAQLTEVVPMATDTPVPAVPEETQTSDLPTNTATPTSTATAS